MSIADAIDEVAARYPDIPVTVVIAARALMDAVVTAPDAVQRGYNPTLILIWSAHAIQVEVTPKNFEFYGLGPSLDIRHFPHDGGTVLSADLLTVLPKPTIN